VPATVTYRILPLLCEGVALIDVRRVEVRLRWQPGVVEATLPVNLGDLLLDFFVS
jgi:hypothetical protein